MRPGWLSTNLLKTRNQFYFTTNTQLGTMPCIINYLFPMSLSLTVCHFSQVDLVNIGGTDIVDGNHKLTLGLIWSIILHWQVSTHTSFHPHPAHTHTQRLINVCSDVTSQFTDDPQGLKIHMTENHLLVCTRACMHVNMLIITCFV